MTKSNLGTTTVPSVNISKEAFVYEVKTEVRMSLALLVMQKTNMTCEEAQVGH